MMQDRTKLDLLGFHEDEQTQSKQRKGQLIAGIGDSFNGLFCYVNQRSAGEVVQVENVHKGTEGIQQGVNKGHAEGDNCQFLAQVLLSLGLACVFQEANTQNADDDDDDGDDDGGDDKPTPEDRVCRFEGAKLYYEYCGDIYNSGFNSWTLLIANDDMSDEWLMLEVMTDATGSDSFYGEYRVSDEYGEYVALQGSMIVDGSSTYTYGSWYVDAENGELIQLSDGWIKIESAGEKLVRVEFEVADSRGVTLICDWTGREVSVLDLVDTSSVKSLRRSAQRVLSPSVVY
jgi:hypothetical protein